MADTYWPDAVARQATALKTQGEEIEQLRGDLDRLSDHYQKLMAECDEKDSEIERLRALLDVNRTTNSESAHMVEKHSAEIEQILGIPVIEGGTRA